MSSGRESALDYAAEHTRPAAAPAHVPWRILVVDDDPDVHASTRLALRSAELLGRPLELLHADSVASARAQLAAPDLAVVLLDVVMEEADSGLQLVRMIRDEFGLLETRIILRTGQPGHAPEMDAVRDYDINDYKTKSELTRSRLITALTAALRAYDQIHTLNTHRRGLAFITRASRELLACSTPHDFCRALLPALQDLLGAPSGGRLYLGEPEHADRLPLVAASDPHVDAPGHSLATLEDADARSALLESLAQRAPVFSAAGCALHFESRDGQRLLVWLALPLAGHDPRKALLEAFCATIAAEFDNVVMFSRLARVAYLDALTGLNNRHSLIQHLDTLLQTAAAEAWQLVLIDLDGFGESNDMLGHQHGDTLLVAVAQRLTEALGQRCTLARLSGDTFAALGPVAVLAAESLQALFRLPFRVLSQEIPLSASMGSVSLDGFRGDGAAALKSAYFALRKAKSEARGQTSAFSTEMESEIRARSRMLQALRTALDHQKFTLLYQPQVSLADDRVAGVEALLRWREDDGTLIAPSEFIPLAEHAGLIVPIGEWILHEACRQQVRLARAGYPTLTMGINVSVRQLRQPDFVASLLAALRESAATPEHIELEITESMAMENSATIQQTLEDIKALGVRVAIDDFGTGFSSLSYLQRLRVDRLKIDRSFIAELCSGERAQQIPAALIQLGHRLDISIMAEGVEDAAQAGLLRELGCDGAQGYLFARPLTESALMAWLQARPIA